MNKSCVFPAFLQKKDKVAIVSPSGSVDPELIDGACSTLISWGLVPVVGAYAKGKHHRFAGTDEQRIFDMQQALDDPSISAILCGRGGYGMSRIVDKLDFKLFKQRPKWIIGFSDITALHARIEKEGYASIHGVMAKALAHAENNQLAVESLRRMLMPENSSVYHIESRKENRKGEALGRLVGGNLSLLYALQGTPYAIQPEGKILFIEDLSERMYHIDRMIQTLRLAGVFKKISGLIVGQFTDIDPDDSFGSVENIVLNALEGRKIPVAFNFPVGHVTDNVALLHGADVRLMVNKDGADLQFVSPLTFEKRG
jgi:muramoyltetrapeptide carboxypeptidase